MAVRLRKRGKYWSVDYRVNGKRIRKALNTSDRGVANKIRAEIEKQLTLNGHDLSEIGECSLSEFSEIYFRDIKEFKRPTTLATEEIFWRQFSEWLGEAELSDITGSIIEEYQRNLIQTGNKPRSVNDKIKHISAMLGYAVKWSLMKDNPCKGIAKIKVPNNPPKYLDDKQVKKILRIAKKRGSEIHLVFALGIYAGLRKNEIVNMRWEWIDFSGERITLQNHGDFVLKSKESRTIPLNKKLAEILKPHRKDAGYILNPEKENSGKYRYRVDFKKSFQGAVKEAGVEWCAPHALRHTFASQLVMAGVSIYKVSKWLGHADVRTTMIYSHLAPSDEDINRI